MDDARRRAVAERLGWTRLHYEGQVLAGHRPDGIGVARVPMFDPWNWADAGLLLDWLAAQRTEDGLPRFRVTIHKSERSDWWAVTVMDYPAGSWHKEAPTGPAAVLAAFLAAVGEEG